MSHKLPTIVVILLLSCFSVRNSIVVTMKPWWEGGGGLLQFLSVVCSYFDADISKENLIISVSRARTNQSTIQMWVEPFQTKELRKTEPTCWSLTFLSPVKIGSLKSTHKLCRKNNITFLFSRLLNLTEPTMIKKF